MAFCCEGSNLRIIMPVEEQPQDIPATEPATAEVHLWDAFAAVAATISDQVNRTLRGSTLVIVQSFKALSTYRKEIGDFVTAVKGEASEALKIQEETLKEQFGADLPSPTHISEKLKHDAQGILDILGESIGIVAKRGETVTCQSFILTLNEEFMTGDHSTHKSWASFKATPAVPLLPAHKQAILLNDTNLNALYADLVPNMTQEARFWEGWMFYNYLKKAEREAPKECRAVDWESWDNEGLATLSDIKSGAGPNAVAAGNSSIGEEWDEWE